MHSDPDFQPLCHVQHNIELARSFVSGHSYETFQKDHRTIYAVVRCLEIISEATRRLSADLKARHPTLRWSAMAGAGNVYRHDYEEVADRLVWETVQHRLEPLAQVVRVELERLNKP